MNWSSIIVALITGGLALMGVYLSNRRSGALIAYRLEKLEAKVDKHNKFAERMPVVEEQIKIANHRLDDLERKVDKLGAGCSEGCESRNWCHGVAEGEQ